MEILDDASETGARLPGWRRATPPDANFALTITMLIQRQCFQSELRDKFCQGNSKPFGVSRSENNLSARA